MIKKILKNQFLKAINLNFKNIINLLEVDNNAKFLDLGCFDGFLTKKISEKINTKKVYGADILDEMGQKAMKKGILVKNFNLNAKFDFKDGFFDVINANQVVEHLYNSDNFFSEIFRVLKPGGYAIISTENGSSWCNVFAAIFGWQIFSLTNISSKRAGLGNPFSLHRNEKIASDYYNHVRIYNFRGLKEYLEIFGFKIEKIKGAGYFPLPAFFGNFDKIHSHFMTFKVRKM